MITTDSLLSTPYTLRPIFVLTGPTAVGKTEAALRVAERMNAEIVSADSMAIYREMDAATAKPAPEERARVPHHMVDIVNPDERFTVADYRREALAAIDDIRVREKKALVVGGTRLYVLALTRGFFEGPGADDALRERLEREADEAGLDALHARLAEVDPESGARIAPGDRKRILRALEVHALTGRPITEWQKESQAQAPPCEGPWVALTRDREELYDRINRRVDEMIENGLVEEVRGLLEKGYDESLPALQGHGYKEIIGALKGRYPLEHGIYLLKRNTRHHAKRQLSWLRNEPGVQWVRADREPERVAEEILAVFNKGKSETEVQADAEI
ncbi:MAG: tRNA (adenosine(37)-N6)-dimethylallyltransferase MiaA [Armatimonadetes bacterium]|nr:tRNA (adenosine(37)-N6)-dimethylallyltransferase MiaA [Armatimonadota bacterium]